MKRGDVVLLEARFSDRTGSKVRPALDDRPQPVSGDWRLVTGLEAV